MLRWATRHGTRHSTRRLLVSRVGPIGIYQRKDSPFWWMSIGRPGQRSLLQSTIVPVNDGTANQPRDNCEPAQAVYVSRIGNLARARYQLPIAKPGVTFAAYREWYLRNVSGPGHYVDPRARELGEGGRAEPLMRFRGAKERLRYSRRSAGLPRAPPINTCRICSSSGAGRSGSRSAARRAGSPSTASATPAPAGCSTEARTSRPSPKSGTGRT